MKFGTIDIDTAARQVRVGGVAVALGARAFDLLVLLVENRQRVIGKDEIFASVWPGLVVEDNNLSVQIHALRRALGAQAITTVTGRGYRFTAAESSPADMALAPLAVQGNLPVRKMELFGRDQDMSDLMAACNGAGCVTLCGLAGVGKTALATLVAQHLAEGRRPAHGAWRVSLAEVREPTELVRTICQSIGLELEGPEDPLSECVAQLQHRDLLLMLDNCEHVIESAAEVISALLSRAGRVTVLATSQEPLRVAGERVLRLNPLDVPAAGLEVDALQFGAVRMLRERVRDALGGGFEPTGEELVDLVEIARQLDGIPLALEFAASRVPLLGTAGVRNRLHDRLRLLAGGVRSAPPRHRSLQAALEWSHQLLSPRTQSILHRLAIFPAGFSLEAALMVLQADDEADVIEHLNVLVDRSLISRQPGPSPRYRMLETTRAFALDCLAAAGGGTDWKEHFACAMARICVKSAEARDSGGLWREMPNLRAALSWAVQSPGLGVVAVTIATYSSVVLGAGGAIREALDLLLRVRHLVTDDCPPPLEARYWQWLGRLGVEGRLPTSVCVDALLRADAMFVAQGNLRHRHACRRHLAEAELRSGHLRIAQQHLDEARAMEGESTSAADRMRRMRVEALLADARGEHEQALRHSQQALAIAEARAVERYRLLLMADMGWTYLQMGRAEAAVTSFQELLFHLDGSIRQGLARARAMVGLMAALVAAGRISDAERSAARSVSALQQANLLRSRCDVFALVLAVRGDMAIAAQLLGAGDAFTTATQTERDPISKLARARAVALVEGGLDGADVDDWMAQGRAADESQLLALLERSFARHQSTFQHRWETEP